MSPFTALMKIPKSSISPVYTSTKLALPRQSYTRSQGVHPVIKNLPITEYSNVQPKIIICLMHAFLSVPVEIPTVQESGGPIAVKTRLGWMVYGANNSNMKQLRTSRHAYHIRNVSSDNGIDDVISSYFSMESFGVKLPTKPVKSKADERAMEILHKSTKKSNGRFVSALLWRENFTGFPENFEMAHKRLQIVERKMKRDETYAQQYGEKMDDYLKKGYAHRLKPEEDLPSPKSFYLPHFAVRNTEAAAEVNGMSLNKTLLAGPDLN